MSPPRPVRPAFQNIPNASLHQESKQCQDFIEWLEKRMEDQDKRLVRAEIGRAEDNKRAASDMAGLKERNRRAMTDFGRATAEKKEYEKKVRVAEDKLASLEQREETLKIATMKLKHLETKSKTFQDLSDAVVAMGAKVEKASRDMKNSAARKSTQQSAFDKWERQYCEPSIRLVQLNEQVKQERDENREEHAVRSRRLQEQEISQSQTTDQNEEEKARLAVERQAFLAEKQAWYLKKGQTLSETEFKLTLNVCVEKRLEEITPLIVKEAQRYIWTLQEADWDERKTESIANAKEQGHEDGYTQGLAEGRRIASTDRGEIECEAYNDGYSVGYEAGKTFGMDWVEAEHEIKLPRIQEDAGHARETILLSTIRRIDHSEDGTIRRIYACCADMTCSDHRREIEVQHQFRYSQEYSYRYSDDWASGDPEFVQEYTRGKVDGEAQGYEKGRNAGQSQGHQKGYAKGYARGFTVGHSQGNDDNWESAYDEGYADANAGFDGQLDAAHKKGVDAVEETFKPRLDSERQAGKTLGYNSGWIDGYEAHKSMRSRQETEEAEKAAEAAEALANSWGMGGDGDPRDDGWGQLDQW
ncbi:hypothetical protein J4E90_009276 [Alternaria incomplexa]|uniref:uncharacterized protein n=1 Tax=Alternaria incomplexa TaxID=1187928 RepID=UPI00222037F5|nr:uncharacterized protein J4E90_009276 [Alternaria incomplexa]KAI4907868.1 hypothetical protein J4E90_009276 [Alternaria incomplexa]